MYFLNKSNFLTMKKLKLKALELGATEVLTREQLKKVLGGDGTCAATWNSSSQTGNISVSGSSLHVKTNPDGSKTYTLYGADKNTASGAAANGGSGAHWCCDSCGSASWYNP
jgi:hypothetical protein